MITVAGRAHARIRSESVNALRSRGCWKNRPDFGENATSPVWRPCPTAEWTAFGCQTGAGRFQPLAPQSRNLIKSGALGGREIDPIASPISMLLPIFAIWPVAALSDAAGAGRRSTINAARFDLQKTRFSGGKRGAARGGCQQVCVAIVRVILDTKTSRLNSRIGSVSFPFASAPTVDPRLSSRLLATCAASASFRSLQRPATSCRDEPATNFAAAMIFNARST